MAVAGLLLAGCHSGASGRRGATTNTTRPTFVTGASSAGFTVLVGRDESHQPCASLVTDTRSTANAFSFECPTLDDLDVEHNLSDTGSHVLWGLASKRVSRVVVKGGGGQLAQADVTQTSGLYSYVVLVSQPPGQFTVVGLDSSGLEVVTVRSDEIPPVVPKATGP